MALKGSEGTAGRPGFGGWKKLCSGGQTVGCVEAGMTSSPQDVSSRSDGVPEDCCHHENSQLVVHRLDKS